MKYDESKGSLANYYKLRCDGLVSKEYRKSQAQKRVHSMVSYVDEFSQSERTVDVDDFTWIEFINSIPKEDRPIVEMIHTGYTQKEVANFLGVTQSYVSKILKRIGKEYGEKANR